MTARPKWILLICLGLAGAFVLLRSFSTSPLFPDYYGNSTLGGNGDSAQFQTIGWAWTEGLVPYRDLFDHKGPIIFLINAIGYLISWRVGIVVIQTICLATTLFFIFKISCLVSKRYFYGLTVIILSLIFLLYSYADGNSVQEYVLPFLAAATFYIADFLTKHRSTHRPARALLYGVAVGVCLMTQATLALSLAAGVLVIMIILIFKKQWQNLRQNLICGLIGISLVVLPCFIYFWANGCFSEFIFAVFTFNFEYAAGIGSWLHGATGSDFFNFTMIYLPFWCVFITAVLAFYRRKYGYGAFLMLSGVLESYLFFSAQSFAQYAIPTLVQLPLFINEIFLLRDRDRAENFARLALFGVVIVMAYNMIMSYIQIIPDKRLSILSSPAVGYEEMIEPYLDELKIETFLAYGDTELKDIYLKYQILPAGKYLAAQWWHASFDESVHQEIRELFASGEITFVLVDAVWQESDYLINDILVEDYELIAQAGEFELYRWADD